MKKNKLKKTPFFKLVTFSFFEFLFLPTLLVFALPPAVQPGNPSDGILGFILQLKLLMNSIAPFLVALAVFVIMYGILGFISSAADEEKRKQAKDFIIWGVIGVVTMLSIWGLVAILASTFSLNNSNGIVTQIYKTAPLPSGAPTTVLELIGRVMIIGNYIIGLFISIAVFIIILGIFNYIREGDNEEKRVEARRFVMWGVISVFLMLSVWGLINILIGTFNFDQNVPSLTGIFDNLRIK